MTLYIAVNNGHITLGNLLTIVYRFMVIQNDRVITLNI